MPDPWDDIPDPVDAAVHFEAVKVSMIQNKDGYMLKVAIHPNDVPDSILRDYVGYRYTVAMVLMNDQNEPVVPKDKAEGDKAVKVAGALCRNKKFWAYAEVDCQVDAEDWLRDKLTIDSRAELRYNRPARDIFFGIVGEFKGLMETGHGK